MLLQGQIPSSLANLWGGGYPWGRCETDCCVCLTPGSSSWYNGWIPNEFGGLANEFGCTGVPPPELPPPPAPPEPPPSPAPPPYAPVPDWYATYRCDDYDPRCDGCIKQQHCGTCDTSYGGYTCTSNPLEVYKSLSLIHI